VRWLLIKDLQILKRSPLLTGLLAVYPVLIALMIGFALSSPPGKPKVAFYSEVPPANQVINFGGENINLKSYEQQLFQSIDRVKVNSADEAIAKVRSGAALAALIVPAEIPAEIKSFVTTGIGRPTVELYLNSRDPLERQVVDQAITARLNAVNESLSQQVLRVAIGDLQQVLNGGTINFAGQNFRLLGLRNARTIVNGTIGSLPQRSALRAALHQVVAFADLAIQGLAFANPTLSGIVNPLNVHETDLAGKTTPSDSYAAAIAVIISLMFVALLLAAGMLAIERSEHAYSRLVRGLVSPNTLLGEKVTLAAVCAGLVTLVMAAFVSLFVHLDWTQFELWILALGAGGLAFGALGVAIGGIAREVSAASLMAILISLPIAFIALVPANAVSGTLKSVLDAIAFVFPFKAALDAVNYAFSGTSPGILGPIIHLLVLTLAFSALARLALRRFA
jgi:ABC-type transport system involved in cytochrome c biogenesis permease component